MSKGRTANVSFRQLASSFLLEKSTLTVIVGFCFLALVNISTLLIGPDGIINFLTGHYLGIILAPFVFDSWGTISGLLGVVILFVPLLVGTPRKERQSLSTFFLFASVAIGLASTLIWNMDFNTSETIPYGSSSIDISAQAIIFTLSFFGLFRVFRQEPQPERYVRNSIAIIYATLILTTLWFVLYLEPIFVPSDQYNWRVHEIAFLIGILATLIYVAIYKKKKL